MNLREAQTLALTAMRAHGLNGWTFSFNRSKTTFGMCYHTRQEIQLSSMLTQHADRHQVIQTIGHEIAHALVGKAAGHGPVWKTKMRSMGLSPDRCGETNEQQKIVLAAAAKYLVTCPIDGKQIATMNRLVKTRRNRRTGTLRVYKGHVCRCHSKPALYNGRSWDDIV